MAMDEATQSSAPEGDAPGKTPDDNAPSSDAPAIDDLTVDAPTDAQTWHLWKILSIVCARYVLGFLIAFFF